MLFRHLLSIAILPFTMAVIIPFWIARQNRIVPALGSSPATIILQLGGVVVLGLGFVPFSSSLRRFATEGEGTLAPWDPPRRLVVRGPYRFVRNPMISGLILVLAGEAMVLASRPHALWALTFFAINAIYIPLFEEPFLRQRFGEDYDEYCRHVPRMLPRATPWNGAK